MWLLVVLFAASLASPCAPHAFAAASPSPTAENVTALSAERANVERAKIDRAGVAYTGWLDGVAERVDRRCCHAGLRSRDLDAPALVARHAAGVGNAGRLILWIIRKRAGRIESAEEQSWLALSFAAVRKPLALLACIVGAFLPSCRWCWGCRIARRGMFLTQSLSTIIYGGRVIAVLWLIFQAIRAVEKRLRRWAQESGSVFNMVLVPVIGQTLRLIVPLLAIILLLPLFGCRKARPGSCKKRSAFCSWSGLCFLIVRGTSAVQKGLMAGHKMDVEDNLPARQIYTRVSVIRRIIMTAVIIIGAASILMMFGPLRQFGTSILASAGIAGIVLGFAAQKTLGNVLAGIQIALSQPMLIDDVVVVEGEFGRIEEITLTFVVVRTWDLRRLVLPITYFIEKPFQNWSRKSAKCWGRFISTWITRCRWARYARN